MSILFLGADEDIFYLHLFTASADEGGMLAGMSRFLKTKRGLSRALWGVMRFLPDFLQTWILRRQVNIPYKLSNEYCFKIAETEEEIREALTIVYDSYRELDYIDPDNLRFRFTPWHALPSTIIIVAKKGNEVIGTMSIVQDSPVGLPCDATWVLNSLREKGYMLGEFSAFSIKKGYRSLRGQISLPLMNTATAIARKYLRLDAIVAATTIEVGPFYKKVLLFNDLPLKGASENHSAVKGNPSFCGYLELGESFITRFYEAYSKAKKNQNLYHYFCLFHSPHIRLPKTAKSLHILEQKLNNAKAELFLAYNRLSEKIDPHFLSIIKNMDSESSLRVLEDKFVDKEHLLQFPTSKRRAFRYRVRHPISVRRGSAESSMVENSIQTLKGELLEVSNSGIMIRLRLVPSEPFRMGEKVFVTLRRDQLKIDLEIEVRWVRFGRILGAALIEIPQHWQDYLLEIEDEIKAQSSANSNLRKTS